MKTTWRTEHLSRRFSFLLLLLLAGCGQPVSHEHIQCGGDYAKEGRLTGSGATARLQSNDFGSVQCRVMGLGSGGSAALQAFRGGPGPVYTVTDLQPGEYFRLNADQVAGSHGRLHVYVRMMSGYPVWEIMQPLAEVRPDGHTTLALDWEVPAELRGFNMEVRLEAGPSDSVALFENFSIRAFPRSLLPRVHRTSHWIDERDGRSYRLVHIAQRWWLAEDLAYGAFKLDTHNPWRYHHDYAYTYAEALAALPGAFRLPTDADWDALEAATGMRPRNAGEPQPYVHTPALRWGGNSGFDVLPGVVVGLDSLHTRYWSASPADTGSRWIRHFGADIRAIRMQSPESQRLHVRAILNTPGLDNQ